MPNKTRFTGNLVSDNNIFSDIANDRVGIGTTNPTSTLHVVGTSLITGISTIGNLRITPVGTGATVGGVGVVTYYGDGGNLINIPIPSKTYAVFASTDNQPPATAFATLDTRNSVAVLDFDDTTDESAVFVGVIPEAASLGSGLKIRIVWTATTATSGACVWDASIERMNTDIDSNSFDTIASVTTTTSGTSGIPNYSEITLTTIDSVTAGDGFRLKINRDANNGSDTMTGDAELIAVEVRSAA
jgi:hypothetical protein